jgi:hypothetical protein
MCNIIDVFRFSGGEASAEADATRTPTGSGHEWRLLQFGGADATRTHREILDVGEVSFSLPFLSVPETTQFPEFKPRVRIQARSQLL